MLFIHTHHRHHHHCHLCVRLFSNTQLVTITLIVTLRASQTHISHMHALINTKTGTTCTLLKHTCTHTHKQVRVAGASQPVLLVSSAYKDALCVCVWVCAHMHMFLSASGSPAFICMSLKSGSVLMFVCVFSPPLMFWTWWVCLCEASFLYQEQISYRSALSCELREGSSVLLHTALLQSFLFTDSAVTGHHSNHTTANLSPITSLSTLSCF